CSSMIGALTCLFLLVVALTGARPPQVSIAGVSLGCFGVWLVAGLLQRAVETIRPLMIARSANREARAGEALAAAAALGVAVLIEAAGYVMVTDGLDLPRDWYEAQAISVFAYFAFFLAIICAYWFPPEESGVAPRGRISWLRDRVLWAVCILWGAV